jgi:hypothetical protein
MHPTGVLILWARSYYHGHMLLIGVHLIGGRLIDMRLAGMRLIVVRLTGLCLIGVHLIGRASHMRASLVGLSRRSLVPACIS